MHWLVFLINGRVRPGILLFALLVSAGCAGYHKPDVPQVEDLMHSSMPTPSTKAPEVSVVESSSSPTLVRSGERWLTLEGCVQIALDKNPMNRAAKEGVVAVEEAVGVARAPYYPTLGLTAGYDRWTRHAFLPSGVTTSSDQIGPTDDWSTGLEARFTIFDFGARRANLRAAIAEQGATEEDAAKIRQDIALDVHQSFYSLVATKENLSVAEKKLDRTEDHLRLTKTRHDAGAVPIADVYRAQVEVADAQLELVRAKNLVRIASGDLNTAMGLPVELSVGVDARAEKIESPENIVLDQAFAQAVHMRPELKSALYGIAARRHRVDEAKSAFGPTVEVFGNYGWRDEVFLPEDEDWLAGLSLELPIFSGFSNKHKLAQTKAELRQTEADTLRLVQEVRREVWNAHSNLIESFETIQAAEVLVEDAQESMRTTRKRYEVGAGTITDLLDAQTSLARAEATDVEARWNYHIAKAQLQRATGDLLGGSQY
ncbi:MAG: TolC family protein [Desulfuromonadaceae bacterium]|nr:TolC family protein [Desulfuromonadaceae bacterium]